MAASPDAGALTALLTAQDNAREQAAGQARALVEQAVTGFTGWYNTQSVADWSTQVATMVEDVLRGLAYLMDAFLAEIIGALTGRHIRPAGPVDVTALRLGITPAGAYGRVADTYRYQQSQLDQIARDLTGNPNPTVPDLQDPIGAALDRAEAVTDLNGQLVVRNQAQASMQAQADRGLITGWRRVPHPELSKGGTCGLCWAASDRIYRTGELMPIHHRCHCLPMPVTAEHDIGSAINTQDLTQLYGDAGSTDAAALKRTRYQVTEHGELGPILNPPGKVRTARQAKADENRPPRRPNTPDQNVRNLRSLRDGLVPSLAKLDQLVAADPATWAPFRQTVSDRIADLESQLQQAA